MGPVDGRAFYSSSTRRPSTAMAAETESGGLAAQIAVGAGGHPGGEGMEIDARRSAAELFQKEKVKTSSKITFFLWALSASALQTSSAPRRFALVLRTKSVRRP